MPNPPLYPPEPIRKCNTYAYMKDPECITIAYGIIGESSAPWVDYSLEYLSNMSGLELGVDIVKIS